MRPNTFFLLSLSLGLLSASESRAAVNNATVVVIRGTAKTSAGAALKEQDKVAPGTTVTTGARSFVRLMFPDQTQLNVGPDTTMKIEVTKAGEASIVDLVGGQIRAKVTKDPHLQENANGPVKEKMVVKTKTAAMGIRGTDFNVSFNQLNNITALITFEGNVAMAKLDGGGANPFSALHQSSGVQSVGAGQFSGVQPDQPQASIPVKISPAQLETLKGNADFKGLGEKGQKQSVMASPIPPGVDPKGFSSGAEKSLKEAMAKAVGESKMQEAVTESKKGDIAAKATAPAEGFLNKSTGEYAPRAGGFIDLASGRYVPPPAGSSFDANTGVFVPPRAMGSVDPATGMYVPPKGVDLDPVKGFVAEKAPAPADGARQPSGAGTAAAPPPPPSAGVTNLVAVLNTQSTPEASTKTVTMDSSLSGGSTVVSGANGNTSLPLAPPPPPPPVLAPPPPPPSTDPVSTQPVSGNCATDNSCGGVQPAPGPTSTGVNFHINVLD